MLLSQEEVTPSSQRFASSWRPSSTVLLCPDLKSQTLNLFLSLVIVQQHSEHWVKQGLLFISLTTSVILSPGGISLGR